MVIGTKVDMKVAIGRRYYTVIVSLVGAYKERVGISIGTITDLIKGPSEGVSEGFQGLHIVEVGLEQAVSESRVLTEQS